MTTHTAEVATLGELDLGEDFKDIEIRVDTCGNVIEKLNCTILLDWNQSAFTVELIGPYNSHLKTIIRSVRLAVAVNQWKK